MTADEHGFDLVFFAERHLGHGVVVDTNRP
jgi:alkanesulfonate monooxygenase SsuD/methylene tetrahydromethanopterin reductase-like flavin-dependent oxidoreductase (luciferase family)